MNTKSKTIAIMLTAIMVSAVAVPMAVAVDVGDVIVDVVSNAPEVICKCEGPDDYSNKPGTQIDPNPDGNKTVTICACVCDKNGVGDISSVSAQVFYPDTTVKAGNVPMQPGTCTVCPLYKIPDPTRSPVACDCSNQGPCQEYTGTFNMTSCDPAGEYRVVVTATDSANNVDKFQNRFFYESIVVLEIVPSTIDFGQVEICTVSYNETQIHNKGNDPAIVTVSTDGLAQEGGAGVIAPGDLDIAIGTEGHKWLTDPVTFDTILECCEWHTLNFSIHVKDGTPSGTYKGTINFTAEHAPDMKLLFENKDSSDKYLYDPILNPADTMTGDMDYNMSDCSYEFHGYGLDPNTHYCLIYYSEPWATQGAGVNITSGTTDGNGGIQLSGTLPCMPMYGAPGDYEYDLAGGKYGKIWLVPCSDMTGAKLTGWHPSKILFEIETIDTIACCS